MANRLLRRPFTAAACLLAWSAAMNITVAPARAGDASPVRWNTGGAVWTTNPEALETFVSTGEITDRGLDGGLNGSGWSAQQVRQGLAKSYAVDLISLSRFLYSDNGVRFLDEQTRSYVPYATLKAQAVEALRSAIIADAADGTISGAGILKALPVDFRLAQLNSQPPLDGRQNVWAQGGCQGERQCSSLLSWAVFLPANLQAISQGNR